MGRIRPVGRIAAPYRPPAVPDPALHAYWIFSLPRSGSSVTAYAMGAALSAPVADEVFGPWDRTGPPYNFPPRQKDLVAAHHACGCRFTPEVVEIATDVLTQIARRLPAPDSSRPPPHPGRLHTLRQRLAARLLHTPPADGELQVIIKHPHLRPEPAEFRAAFPTHRAVWLLRNPLTRLNSLYARGWTENLRPNFELEHYKAFARNWLAQPRRARVTFELMRRRPEAFYRQVMAGWGLRPAADQVAEAVQYARRRYHASSAEIDPAAAAQSPLSESRHALPREAVEMYLQDEFILALMRRQRWPVEVGAYVEKE